VRCYVEEDDTTSALSYLNRIKNIIHGVKDKETRLHFNLNQAKILDSQRSFLDASAAYHSISQETLIAEDERLRALSEAMKCAVLAPAGPLRGRTLAKLYKDDRANQVDEFGILEKIFLNRLLTQEEVAAFASTLQPHQLAKTADNSTVLDKAVLEHNLLAASRLYSNIGIAPLGLLLGVDADRAEAYASQMIEQGRLSGYIDQIAGFIYFEGEGTGEKKTRHESAVVGREVRKWDANVQGLAEEVEKVTSAIQNSDPRFYAEHMVH
jgi:COP9 signalosome complex subunit 4